uniref:Uncharacterized protein n=1 Tax=Arundo donax TaxID=35708 RepID=A0A0A9GPA1_ARUDO
MHHHEEQHVVGEHPDVVSDCAALLLRAQGEVEIGGDVPHDDVTVQLGVVGDPREILIHPFLLEDPPTPCVPQVIYFPLPDLS